MRSSRSLPFAASVLALGAAAYSCGPTIEPVVGPTPIGSPTATTTATTSPVVELAPVDEPKGVAATVRWKSVNASLAGMIACSKIPSELSSLAQSGLGLALSEALFEKRANAETLAAALDLDQPIDAVLFVQKESNDPAYGAFSVPLKSMEAARAAFEAAGTNTESGPEVSVPTRKGLACSLFASSGKAPARIVCADTQKRLGQVGKYLARNVAALPSGDSDLRGEVRVASLEKEFRGELQQGLREVSSLTGSLGLGPLDRTVGDIVAALTKEVPALVSDVNALSFEGSFGSSKCMQANLGIELRGTQSFVAQTLAERPERQRTAPPMFWRLPKDVSNAQWAIGGDTARFAPITKALRELTEGVLAQAGFGLPRKGGKPVTGPKAEAQAAAARKAIADLWSLDLGNDVLVVTGGGGVAGLGGVAGALFGTAGAIDRDGAKGFNELEKLLKPLVGWNLVGYDRPIEAVNKMFDSLTAAYNLPGTQDVVKQFVDDELAKNGGPVLAVPTLKASAGPASLGKGSKLYTLTLTGSIPEGSKEESPAEGTAKPGKPGKPAKPAKAAKAGAKKFSFTLYAMTMSDGTDTWVAMGADQAELVKRLQSVKVGAPTAGSLAARSGLDELRTRRAMSAGFTSFGGLVSAANSFADEAIRQGKDKDDAQLVKDVLAKLPHKGDGPFFFFSGFEESRKRGFVSIEVPGPFFEDVGAAVRAGVDLMKKRNP